MKVSEHLPIIPLLVLPVLPCLVLSFPADDNEFAYLDTDRDGFLQEKELKYEIGSDENYDFYVDKMDTDGDSKISTEEYKAYEKIYEDYYLLESEHLKKCWTERGEFLDIYNDETPICLPESNDRSDWWSIADPKKCYQLCNYDYETEIELCYDDPDCTPAPKDTNKEITIEFVAFIPQSIGKPWSSYNFGKIPVDMKNISDNWFQGPPDLTEGTMYTTTNDREHAGEKGGFKARTTIKINSLDIGDLTEDKIIKNTEIGPSHVVHVMDGEIIPGSFQEKTAAAQVDEMTVHNFDENNSKICFKAKSAFPFTDLPEALTPAVDYRMCLYLTHYEYGYAVAMRGVHDQFPAYSASINGKVIYEAYPSWSGPGIMNLAIFETGFRLKKFFVKGPESFQDATRSENKDTDSLDCSCQYMTGNKDAISWLRPCM